MKKYITIITLFLLGWLLSSAQSEFITLWKPGIGNPQTISFMAKGSSFTIHWEEVGYPAHQGTDSYTILNSDINMGNAYNPNPANATYLVKITGGLNQFHVSYEPAKALLEIKQWGNIAWTTMYDAFDGATNLQLTATDAPNLSGVTDMSLMFAGCTALTGNASMNTWNTASVTNMRLMFVNAASFNQNIGNWNTGNVTNMEGMFSGASAFNQNIGSWNTGNVINMNQVFEGATSFNQPIGNWNTSNVTNMSGMFYGASAFNQNINNWNTGNVTNMSWMFYGATAFNQPIGSWNTNKVTNMAIMFGGASAFNQNIAYNPTTGSWNTGNVTNMGAMFSGAASFNQPIGNWNTASVRLMYGMFRDATAFNQDISNWNTASVVFMFEMFRNAISFNQNIGRWHLGSITYTPSAGSMMESMLDGCGMNCSNYAKTITGWVAGGTNNESGINLGASGLSYTGADAKAAHDLLVNTRGWIITGDRYDPDCVPNPAVTGVTGDIVTQVWLSETQPPLFVKRHYQVTPSNDPENATGRVTLYFSNQDFKDFNNQTPAPAKLLPDADEQATVNARKANLRIEKRSGTSTDASGLPGSYTGAVLTIDPNDEDIVWNSSTSLWEVSFDVTGFSGFFIKTTESTLPVTFGDISAVFKNNQLYINWTTLSETGNSHFEIEASKDGKTFTKIATVSSKAAGGNSENTISYEWVATTPNTGIMLGLSAFVMGLSLLAFGRKRKVVYMATVLIALSITGLVACRKYSNENELDNHSKLFIRIKQVDKDGKAEYSKTVKVVRE